MNSTGECFIKLSVINNRAKVNAQIFKAFNLAKLIHVYEGDSAA